MTSQDADGGDDISIDEAAVELEASARLAQRARALVPAERVRAGSASSVDPVQAEAGERRARSTGSRSSCRRAAPRARTQRAVPALVPRPASRPLAHRGSHTAELAEKWGRRVRNLIIEHQPARLRHHARNQAAGSWETTAGGEYFAAGVGGSIAGWRGDLVLIDDPLRSREDAESATIRDKNWDWYRSDVIPRLKPRRAHSSDTDPLARRRSRRPHHRRGRAGGDQWEVISLPALAEDDDPLGRSPARRCGPTGKTWSSSNASAAPIGPRDWTALFQQRPAPEEGDYFKVEWLKPVRPPARPRRPCASTAAATTRSPATAATTPCMPSSASIPITACICSTSGASRRLERPLGRGILRSGPQVEADRLGRGEGPDQRRHRALSRSPAARAQGPLLSRELPDPRRQDHPRAMHPRPHGAGGLYVPEFAPWYPALRSELLSFPNGMHDDQVDALGLVGQLLDTMLKGTPAKPKILQQPTAATASSAAVSRRRRLASLLMASTRCAPLIFLFVLALLVARHDRDRRDMAVGYSATLSGYSSDGISTGGGGSTPDLSTATSDEGQALRHARQLKRSYTDYLFTKRPEITEQQERHGTTATARSGPPSRSRCSTSASSRSSPTIASPARSTASAAWWRNIAPSRAPSRARPGTSRAPTSRPHRCARRWNRPSGKRYRRNAPRPAPTDGIGGVEFMLDPQPGRLATRSTSKTSTPTASSTTRAARRRTSPTPPTWAAASGPMPTCSTT